MPRDPRAWLADIVAACDLLIEFTEGKTFSDCSADPLLRSAVERQFDLEPILKFGAAASSARSAKGSNCGAPG